MMKPCCNKPCYHPTGLMLTCNPPINVMRCCNCGVQQQEQYELPTVPQGHGAYYPMAAGGSVVYTVSK